MRSVWHRLASTLYSDDVGVVDSFNEDFNLIKLYAVRENDGGQGDRSLSTGGGSVSLTGVIGSD